MVGVASKAAVHVWLDTTYYRWIDWCVHHLPPDRKSKTFFCRSYGCRLSIIFCIEECKHREGY